MKTDEALDFPEPQKPQRRARREKANNISKLYFLVIYILITILVVLCLYNIALYNSNRRVSSQYNEPFIEIKSIQAENKNLKANNDHLATENNTIKDQYKSLREENEKFLDMLSDIKKKNDEITSKNKELTEDNIELQNSLKMAAAVGIKPQNFTNFNGLSSRGEIERGKYIGKFLGTAYTPSAAECGNSKGITNSGKPVIAGVSLAVDGKYWPFGTIFYIKGLGYAVAMDTGSAIKGKKRFDFAVFDKKFAKELGSKYWEVYLVKKGNGKIERIDF